MNEELEDPRFILFKCNGLILSFLKVSGKSCTEEARVVCEKGFVNDEALAFLADEDGRETWIRCAWYDWSV
jgi:hypothetical protein